MSEDEIDALMEDLLPEWAVCRARGVLMMGAQLPTRDGRRNGNAHIVGFKNAFVGQGQPAYHILTDAGSEMVMTAEEIAECFYPPVWVSDVYEVLSKFKRNK